MRRKIFCLLGIHPYIEPISGDRINEINMMKAMSLHYDVYYNGVLFDPKTGTAGRKGDKLIIPQKGDYDVIYVRGNPEFFKKCPSPKICSASPYCPDSYEQADGIACITEPWKRHLSSYTPEKYYYFTQTIKGKISELYPRDMQAPKNCLLFPQSVDVDLKQIDINKPDPIKPPKIKKINKRFVRFVKLMRLTRLMRMLGINVENNSARFIMRHLGPVRSTNFPHQLAFVLKKNKKLGNNILAQAVGPGRKVLLPQAIKNVGRIPKEDTLQAMYKSNALWYNQDHMGHVGGSLKVLEAMVVGVPVILPKWEARVCELGEDYPFFWTLKEGSDISDPDQPDFVDKLEKLMILSSDERKDLADDMRDKAKAFSVESSGEIIKRELDHFFEGLNR